MEQFIVDIPRHPSVHLKADSHVSWFVKSSEEKADKNDAIACIKSQERFQRYEDMPWESCTLHLIFYCNTNRRRDLDNYIARCKKFIDACVFCGLILDDNHNVIRNGYTGEFVVIKGSKPATRMIFTKVVV